MLAHANRSDKFFEGTLAGIGAIGSVIHLWQLAERHVVFLHQIYVSLIAQLVCSGRAWGEKERERERRGRIRTFYHGGDVLSDVRRELSQKIEHRVLSRVPDAQVDPSVQECPHHFHLAAERRLVHRGSRGRPRVHVDARRQQHLHHSSETDRCIFLFCLFCSFFSFRIELWPDAFFFFVDGRENVKLFLDETGEKYIYIRLTFVSNESEWNFLRHVFSRFLSVW